jgi:hypothetical protein
MAGHSRAPGHAPSGATRRTALIALTSALTAPALSACVSGDGGSDPTADGIRRTLAARAAAVTARDERAYLAVLAPELGTLRAEELRCFRNLAAVPVSTWEYRVNKVRRDGARAVAEAELHYRVAGYDEAPVVVPRKLELGLREGSWVLIADDPRDGAAEQLWHQGPVEAVRGLRTLVLGVGQEPGRLRALADTVDRAVPAVSGSWPHPWADRVVVLVPGSPEAMGKLLGTPAASYRGIAAVTTGATGTTAAVPADRVIVNPAAYGLLGDHGREVVITHETTHVATRAHTTGATPMWLSEGFADWVAYRHSTRSAGQNAPELQRAVRRGELPPELPEAEDFAFGSDPDALARAYEGAWMACDLIAAKWGVHRLTELYRAAGRGRDRKSSLRRALAEVLTTTPEQFTARWHDHLRVRLG